MAKIEIALDSKDSDSRDYRGTVGSVPFRVQIREDAAPHWYDSQLDDDAKSDVLDAIDSLWPTPRCGPDWPRQSPLNRGLTSRLSPPVWSNTMNLKTALSIASEGCPSSTGMMPGLYEANAVFAFFKGTDLWNETGTSQSFWNRHIINKFIDIVAGLSEEERTAIRIEASYYLRARGRISDEEMSVL